MRVSPRVEVSVSFMPLALAAVLFGPAAAAARGGAAMLHREGPLERFLIYLSGKTLAGCAAGWTAVVAERTVGVDSLMTLVAVAARRIGRRHRGRVLRHRGHAPHPARHTAARALEAPARLDRRLGGALRAGDRADRVHVHARGRRGAGVLRRAVDRRAPELRHARPPGAADRGAGGLERPARGGQRAAAPGEHQLRGSYGAGARLARQLHRRPLRRGRRLLARHRAGARACRRRRSPEIHLAALVHDIGKIGMRAELLEKRSALDDDEWAEMRGHPAIGARILAEVEDYSDIALDRPQPPRALGRRRISRRARRPRDPAAAPDHRGRRLLQRDDVTTVRTARP